MSVRKRRGKSTAFIDALRRPGPLLLDGGLATQLETQGCDLNNPLWSASILSSAPQAIVDASRAYLDAGAECMATASYQASREGFAQQGLSAAESDRLMLLSVELALQARDEFLADSPNNTRTPLIAASIGPYGAMLHDGSEYTGIYDISAAELHDFHAERLRLFDGSDVDVLALETIPSLREADVLSSLLHECETPAWVSFSCRDQHCISDGTPVAEAAGLFRGHPIVLAVGINCTAPQYVVALLQAVRKVLPDKAMVAYPNSGEVYDAADNTWSGTVLPLDCARAAGEWIAAGAKIVGGCCRMGPEHIHAMANRIQEISI